MIKRFSPRTRSHRYLPADCWTFFLHRQSLTLYNVLNSCMCTEVRTAPIFFLVRNYDSMSRKRLLSSTDVVSYISNKYATNQAIAEYDGKILRNVQPANMTLKQYDDDLVVKAYRVTDVYDKGTLNNVIIKGVQASYLPQYPRQFGSELTSGFN